MKHIDLFSGIGGFALAVDTVWPNSEHIFCDNDPFCQQVLKKHWPKSKIYGDIRTLTTDTKHVGQSGTKEIRKDSSAQSKSQTGAELFKPESAGVGVLRSEETRWDILTGGFPCQPFSQAGRRKGTDDNRYLWPEMLRVIREFKPTWVIAENVRGLLTWNEGLVLEQVCADLESEGYEVQPLIIPAVAVNAPHRRDRVWFIAHNDRPSNDAAQNTDQRGKSFSDYGDKIRDFNSANGGASSTNNVAYTDLGEFRRQQRKSVGKTPITCGSWESSWLEVAAELCGVDDGLPAELDGLKLSKAGHRKERLKGLGNAIVPQVAIEIMKSF